MSKLDGDLLWRSRAYPPGGSRADQVVEDLVSAVCKAAGAVGEEGLGGVAGGDVHPVEFRAFGAAGAEAVVFRIGEVAAAQGRIAGAEHGEGGAVRPLAAFDDQTFESTDGNLTGERDRAAAHGRRVEAHGAAAGAAREGHGFAQGQFVVVGVHGVGGGGDEERLLEFVGTDVRTADGLSRGVRVEQEFTDAQKHAVARARLVGALHFDDAGIDQAAGGHAEFGRAVEDIPGIEQGRCKDRAGGRRVTVDGHGDVPQPVGAAVEPVREHHFVHARIGRQCQREGRIEIGRRGVRERSEVAVNRLGSLRAAAWKVRTLPGHSAGGRDGDRVLRVAVEFHFAEREHTAIIIRLTRNRRARDPDHAGADAPGHNTQGTGTDQSIPGIEEGRSIDCRGGSGIAEDRHRDVSQPSLTAAISAIHENDLVQPRVHRHCQRPRRIGVRSSGVSEVGEVSINAECRRERGRILRTLRGHGARETDFRPAGRGVVVVAIHVSRHSPRVRPGDEAAQLSGAGINGEAGEL